MRKGFHILFLAGLAFGPQSSAFSLPSTRQTKVAKFKPTIPSWKSIPVKQSTSLSPKRVSRNRPLYLAEHPAVLEILTTFLPPCMGFLKSEWTVSYGYGFATAFGALSVLTRSIQGSGLAKIQALALIFYGIRLNSFLFLRNRLSPSYRVIGDDIKERSEARFPSALSKAPFVLSCGLLYYGLVLPVKLMALLEGETMGKVLTISFRVLLVLQWGGYLMGAIGDLTKSYVKAMHQGTSESPFLVTTGIFSVLRHPNFTGEIVSWTANALVGILAGAKLLVLGFASATTLQLLKLAGAMGLSLMGSLGMLFVLLRATKNLEEGQARKYGDTPEYQNWIRTTWSGWYLSSKTPIGETTLPEITLNADSPENFGSGI